MQVDFRNYYTAQQAREIISRNTGRQIDIRYIPQLASYGALRVVKLSGRNFYLKEDVDNYKVEPRGVKAGRVSHQKRVERKSAGGAGGLARAS